MELDFDKEIDALLRKSRRDGPVLVGDVAVSHLDADEIAAFAENTLPEKSRGAYTLHLADCDRCRKILSNLLVMNTEAAPVAAAPPSAITIAERDLPWYRKLFLFPNLAYVMGGLVLVLGGFLAFTVVQRSGVGEPAMVTQVTDEESRRGGPNAESASPADASLVANGANTAANVASGGLPTAANANSSIKSPESGVAGPRVSENNFAIDGLAAGEPAPVAPPPAAAPVRPTGNDVRVRGEVQSKVNEEAKAATGAAISTDSSVKNEAPAKQKADTNMPVQSGPMRNNESNYQRQLENLDRRSAVARKAAPREDEKAGGRRSVGGRTFERKQDVWYDVNYQGRPTINVRRGTAEFEKLDGGLRSIANTLSGTVVVVWGAKAYRIQ